MILNVFGRSNDVGAITYHLTSAIDAAVVAADGADFRVTATLPSGTDLLVQVGLGVLDGPQQRERFLTWLSSGNLSGERLADAVDMVAELRVSVSFVLGDSLTQADLDDTVALAVATARWADGFVVAASSGVILGPDAAVWAEATTEPIEPIEPSAESHDEFVREARRAMAESGTTSGGVVLDAALMPESEASPPTAEELRQRLVVTAAVAARGLNEQTGQSLAEARAGLLDWVEATGAAPALEAWEAQVLTAAPGAVSDRDLGNAAWLTEDVAVLAWAMGLMELPEPEELAEPGAVFTALGLADPDETRRILAGASMRSAGELAAKLDQLRSEYRERREQRTMATSIALERFRAAVWLVEGGSFQDANVAI